MADDADPATESTDLLHEDLDSPRDQTTNEKDND